MNLLKNMQILCKEDILSQCDSYMQYSFDFTSQHFEYGSLQAIFFSSLIIEGLCCRALCTNWEYSTWHTPLIFDEKVTKTRNIKSQELLGRCCHKLLSYHNNNANKMLASSMTLDQIPT